MTEEDKERRLARLELNSKIVLALVLVSFSASLAALIIALAVLITT